MTIYLSAGFLWKGGGAEMIEEGGVRESVLGKSREQVCLFCLRAGLTTFMWSIKNFLLKKKDYIYF